MFIESVVLLVLFQFSLLVYKVFQYKTEQDKLKNIPGPKPLWVVGNALDLSSPEKTFVQLQEWAKRYGGLYKIIVGPMVQYVITDVKLLEHITLSNDLITKAQFYKLQERWLGTGLLTATGDKWRIRRKVITPTFHFKILEQYLHVFAKNSDIFIEKLKGELGKESFDVYPYVTTCTLDVICETAMGVSINAQANHDGEYPEAIRFLANNAIERLFSFIKQFELLYFFTSSYRQEKKCLKTIHDFAYNAIKNRRIMNEKSEYNSENQKSEKEVPEEERGYGAKKRLAFLDMLLQVRIDGKPLTDTDIREEIDTFMFEGQDTTASSISFLIHALAENQDVQQKLFEEIDSIFLGDRTSCPTYAQLQEMKYFELVFKEAQRMYTTVPFVGRAVPKEFKFGDYTFLKGSTLILYFHGLHMDPKNFHEPEKFDPERFRDSSERSVFSFLPFSAGPRNCIGQKFAILEIKMVIAKMLRNFEILPANPKHNIICGQEGIIKSINGIRIKLKKRV